jgi:hypothetical protein
MDAPELACPQGPPLPGVQPLCTSRPPTAFTWGPDIAVIVGTGDPPAPGGGTIESGPYVLVSKTMFGSEFGPLDDTNPTEEQQELARGWAREAAYVECGVIQTQRALFAVGEPQAMTDQCRTLVPADVFVTESATAAGYTATGNRLTTISVKPITSGSDIVGRYTVVEAFVRATAFDADAGPSGPRTPFDASPPSFAPGVRDPRCPASPRVQGDSCDPDPVPLQCEYGGDSRSRCTTLATCVFLAAADRAGAFEFEVSQDMDCPPNPAACPASYAAAALALEDGGVPPLAPDAGGYGAPACVYDEGTCGYLGPGDCPSWSCRPRTVVGAGCPEPRPLAGTPCDQPLSCDYDVPCAPSFSFGPNMACQDGHWASTGRDLTTCQEPPCAPPPPN